MIILLKRSQLLFGILLLGAALCFALRSPSAAVLSVNNGVCGNAPILILDAGHGGEDGGAVSDSGVAESTINLQIVRKMAQILNFIGSEPILTREGEDAVYSADAGTLREKKVSDLKNRVALINRYGDRVLISIHQNSLPANASVCGAQTFFNGVLPAERLASEVQRNLNESINLGNEKIQKAIDERIYLMKQITCPGILVECGFMSNREETQLLLTDAHQVRLAVAVLSGYLQFMTNEETI